jgi:hypothetical protein
MAKKSKKFNLDKKNFKNKLIILYQSRIKKKID